MERPVRVTPLPGAKVLIVFTDGMEGVIDMSGSVGRGVFAPLSDPHVFARVYVGDHGQIAWSEEMEVCPDAAYREAVRRRSREAIHA
jgi:hypothetical protein